MSLSGIGGRHALGPPAYVIAGMLILAGVTLLLKRPFGFYVALAAALVTAATGALAFAHHPELALPVPPIFSVVVGLYLLGRTAMLRLLPPPSEKARGFLPRDKQEG
jgi:hypothetical protein